MTNLFIQDSKILTKRLRELGKAILTGREAMLREFTMRVPADPNRDADLILYAAANMIEKLEETLKALEE